MPFELFFIYTFDRSYGLDWIWVIIVDWVHPVHMFRTMKQWQSNDWDISQHDELQLSQSDRASADAQSIFAGKLLSVEKFKCLTYHAVAKMYLAMSKQVVAGVGQCQLPRNGHDDCSSALRQWCHKLDGPLTLSRAWTERQLTLVILSIFI